VLYLGIDGAGFLTTDNVTAIQWQGFVDGLRRFVARRVAGQDVDDVAQEVMLRIQRGVGGIRDSGRTESWVYSVARRTVADYYRTRARQLSVETQEMEDDAERVACGRTPQEVFGRFPGSHSAHEEVLSWLRPMAEGLPDGYRQALLMRSAQAITRRRSRPRRVCWSNACGT
jgi:RNA polymerase sigma-70 factor (ECF subfamily)